MFCSSLRYSIYKVQIRVLTAFSRSSDSSHILSQLLHFGKYFFQSFLTFFRGRFFCASPLRGTRAFYHRTLCLSRTFFKFSRLFSHPQPRLPPRLKRSHILADMVRFVKPFFYFFPSFFQNSLFTGCGVKRREQAPASDCQRTSLG